VTGKHPFTPKVTDYPFSNFGAVIALEMDLRPPQTVRAKSGCLRRIPPLNQKPLLLQRFLSRRQRRHAY
jgi:hypothetical protein